MLSRSYGQVATHLQRLFQKGCVNGLSERQLLDRYAASRDEAAFDALVARHGPMVLGVCRRMLDDPHAVDDAFQATFLVLVRKAAVLGPHDAIGHWLYGVACRVALRARAETARRGGREVPVEWAEGIARDAEPGDRELAAVLDEELARLPSKYRAPIVLCYLEGLTHEEAARQLQWPVGSVKGRLSRARELLKGRLARRGLSPSLDVLGATLGRRLADPIPEPLRQATVNAALQLTAGGALSGVIASASIPLMEGVLSAMYLTKIKVGTTVLGVVSALALGAWALAQPTRDEGPKVNPAVPTAGRPENEVVSVSPVETAGKTALKGPALRAVLRKPLDLELPQAGLEEMLKAIKKATTSKTDNGVAIYVEPEGLQEAGVNLNSPVTLDAKRVPLQDALDRALRPLKLAATVRNDLLVITSRQEVALSELRRLNDQLQGEGAALPATVESPVAWLRRTKHRRISPAEAREEQADADSEAKTQAVLAALRKRVAMPFSNETPLEDVLKYIKSETQTPELPNGIPIYIDPVGLQEAEKTMTSPVTMDLTGVPLRESLRLILKQLGLVYSIQDGLLSITNEGSGDTSSPILALAEKAELGELSLREMNDLIELFEAREKVIRYAEGRSVDGQPAARFGPFGGGVPAEGRSVDGRPAKSERRQ